MEKDICNSEEPVSPPEVMKVKNMYTTSIRALKYTK